MTTNHDKLEAIDRLVTSSLPQRPFRESTRELLEHAAARSRSLVIARSSADEFRARAATLINQRVTGALRSDTSLPSAPLTVISDTCGQQVLVASSEQARRLSAVQLEHRLSGKPSLLASRTEAAQALLIDAPGEGCDEAFMLGATELSLPAYAACETAFMQRVGRSTAEVNPTADALIEEWGLAKLAHRVRAELVDGNEAGERALRHGLSELARAWQRSARLQTFGEAVADLMNWPILDSAELPMAPAQWREFAYSRPLAEVRERADVLGILPDWNVRHARTTSGQFPVRGSIDYAIARSLAAAPHADVLWLVASSADLNEARRFAEAISARFPEKLLAYQLDEQAADALAARGPQQAHDFSATLAALGFALHVMTEGHACALAAGDCVHLT